MVLQPVVFSEIMKSSPNFEDFRNALIKQLKLGKSKGRTEAWLGNKVDLSQQMINQIKLGKKNTPYENMVKIAEAFGFNLSEFCELGQSDEIEFDLEVPSLKESQAAYGKKKKLEFDRDTLIEVIALTEQWLIEDDRELDPVVKAEAIEILYEYHLEMEKKPTLESVGKYLRLIK